MQGSGSYGSGRAIPPSVVVMQVSSFRVLLAAVFWVHVATSSLSDTAILDIRAVGSTSSLQQAVADGVRHIIVTEHIDAGLARTPGQNAGAIRGRQAIQVKPSMRSIVVCPAVQGCWGCLTRIWCLPFSVGELMMCQNCISTSPRVTYTTSTLCMTIQHRYWRNRASEIASWCPRFC